VAHVPVLDGRRHPVARRRHGCEHGALQHFQCGPPDDRTCITFDPHGGYYHPDHLAVHRATTAAFFSSGTLGETAPARLFYSALSIEMFREHQARTVGWGVVDGLDPEVFGVTYRCGEGAGGTRGVVSADPYDDPRNSELRIKN
jgi:hypothetical protein